MKKYFCIFAALTMLMSCAKSLSEANSQASGEMAQTVTVKVAPFVGLDTKSTISTGGVFAWTSGDKFGVYPLKSTIGAEQTSQQVMFQIQESAVGTNSGLFTGTGWGLVTGGDYKYFAYYPYDAEADYNKVEVSYACNYTITENSSTAHITEDYLVAPMVTPTESLDATFTFYHMGALVNFMLLIPEADREGATFNYLEISCSNPVFATEGYFNPSTASIEGEPAVVTYPEFVSTSTTNKINVELADCDLDQNGYLNIYLMLPPTVLTGETLNISLSGNNYKEYSCARAMTGDLLSGKTYSPVFEMEGDAAPVINLSENGTANCYIVNRTGRAYKFDCKVKGNGVDPVTTDTEDAAISNYESVQVTWETVNTSTALSVGTVILDATLDKENGFISFKTPTTFAEGNALISVKDANEKILWSWHIWATKADLEALAQTYPNEAGIVMDRNLGALACSQTDGRSPGFLYQWGRPFPFVGLNLIGGQVGTSVVTTNNTSWDSVTTCESYGSLVYSAEHPTTFICGIEGGNFLENSSTASNNWLWTEHLAANPELWGATKTMYDPCPVGWKVPSIKVWTLGGFNTDTFQLVENGYGRVFDSPAAFYPRTGRREWLSGNHSDFRRILYWSNSLSGANKASCLYSTLDDVASGGARQPADGYAIRPCKCD